MASWRLVTACVVNDPDAARMFFAAYNIEYKMETDGRILVLEPRDVDRERARGIRAKLRRIGFSQLCDHEFVWRDRDGNTLVSCSPYDVEEVRQSWIEKARHNFCGHGTTTFVIRR